MSSRRRELLEVLDKSGPSLYALLTRLTLREDIAEELMQELFIKLSSARNSAAIESWSAYAHRAAVNLAFDWRRRQKRVPLSLEQVGERASPDSSPLRKLIQSEEIEQTLDAIGRLKKEPRQALVLRYIQQQSYEHIAEQLGRTPHQVRALCSKALNRLRAILKQKKLMSH